MRVEKLSKKALRLVLNLSYLANGEYSQSVIHPIVKLKVLSDDDLIHIFTSSELGLLRGNSALLHRDLAEAMYTERGIRPLAMLQAFKECIDDKRDIFKYEPKILALIRVSEKFNVETREIAEELKKYLDYYLQTDIRLQLFKFIYRKTGDRKILDLAKNYKSKYIRAWFDEELKKMS